MNLADTLREQFERAWVMLRESIVLFPEEQWRADEPDHLTPCRTALHTIGTPAFYCRDQQAGFDWDVPFGDWEGLAQAALPTQEAVLAWLDEVAAGVDDWLAGQTDEALLADTNPFPWTGPNGLSRMVYTLRHHHQHLGELAAELRRRGLDRAGWR